MNDVNVEMCNAVDSVVELYQCLINHPSVSTFPVLGAALGYLRWDYCDLFAIPDFEFGIQWSET